MNIVIRGNSVAAWCCAHLLSEAGFKPVLERSDRPGVPAIMLSDAALTLIRDVFGRPGLFAAAPRITRRVVKWGKDNAPLGFDHSAVVVSERELLDELPHGVEVAGESGSADFTIFAARPLPPGPVEQNFGSRMAWASKVRLKDPRDSSSCWIESLETGWLFLIPNAVGEGWLLSVGDSAQEALGRSKVIAARLASVDEPVGKFPAGPRILSPLCGPEWLACGTAGLAFDPICGDGTAHAVREAILAAGVVRAISEGGDAAELVAHYEARLTAGFQRHLVACLEFYRSGEGGPWWDSELEALRRGLEWGAAKMKNHGAFRYQLIGFELSRLAAD
jgi:hypothetical protein